MDNSLDRSKISKNNVHTKGFKEKTYEFLDSVQVIIFMTIITIYALFADDVKQLIGSVEADKAFNVTYYIIFCIFMIEFLVSCYCVPNYILGLYFFLDLISTASILLDINEVMGNNNSSSQFNLEIARTVKASKIGSKAGRVVRIIRLIRLIRIIKLYKAKELMNKKKDDDEYEKQFEDAKEKADDKFKESRREPLKEDDKELSFEDSENENEDDLKNNKMINSESKISKRLSDLTTKKVVIIVLILLVSIPVFSYDTYKSFYNSKESLLQNILRYKTDYLTTYKTPNEFRDTTTYLNNNIIVSKMINNYRDIFMSEEYVSKKYREEFLGIYLNEFYTTDYQYINITEKDPNNQRNTDIQTYILVEEISQSHNITLTSLFNIRNINNLDAILSICRTIFICIILSIFALLFSKDSSDLVLIPIEKMLQKINNIAENPLNAAKIEEEEAFIMSELIKTNKDAAKEKEELANYETGLLENTIVKIGALLALGFGEAGSEIIAQNMKSTGEINPMIPGKKIIAIFGFCDIRNFTDATEVLQEGVMVFVNEIANIVHTEVDKYLGSANKNIGDAFLLVWKFDQDLIETDENDNVKLINNFKSNALTELSVISFIKIIEKINTSKTLEKYRYNEGLNKRIPHYSVKMGFGLHLGWAIEGAIGSEYKIDASYLSPNVNLASRLEAATKQFGVPILISGEIYNYCSDNFKKKLRKIDVVTVKGSIQPIELFTIDLVYDNLKISQNEVLALQGIDKKRKKYQDRIDKEKFRQKINQNKVHPYKFFYKNKEISDMRSPFTDHFYEVWEEGFNYYISGKWKEALNLFNITLNMINGRIDGPSNTLIEIIKNNNEEAPPNWKGYRELTEK